MNMQKSVITAPTARSAMLLSVLGAAFISMGVVYADASETQKGAASDPGESPGQRASTACKDLPSAADLKRLLKEAAGAGEAGGLDGGRSEWAAIVDRSGELCAVAVSTDDAGAAWPGSQSVAKAKAYTANAFSTDQSPLSTARLYTMAQPGHSLYSLANANPFNPACLETPEARDKGPKICGGTIVFGGGVPLYKGKTRVGGLGASGDTACADHEIAKRILGRVREHPVS
jgi:uncharacterized protein GlcG (DUF336 family)